MPSGGIVACDIATSKAATSLAVRTRISFQPNIECGTQWNTTSLHSLNHKLNLKTLSSYKRLFANSSRERRRIETKLSQPSDAVSDLDLRESACANKLPPRSTRQKNLNRPSAILDLRRKYTIFRARSTHAMQKRSPNGCSRTPPASVDESRLNFLSRRTLYHISI